MTSVEIEDGQAAERMLGEEWIRAIRAGAVEHLAELCHPQAASQLLTHSRYTELATAPELVAKIQQWFGACSDFQVKHSRVEPVGERLGIFYRFHLKEEGAWFLVEQQVYCTLEEGRISRLQLLCSGFQPAPGPEERMPAADGLLVFQGGGMESGATCAMLTPAIKAKLRELESGQVLEVRVADRAAQGDIEAWCRLSGNPLVGMQEAGSHELRFFVRKK